MKTAVLLLNFGEPAETTPEVVIPFLERIFATNVALTGAATPEEARARHRRMAEARAPGLIEEYERIGGSPLAAQAQAQADAVAAELAARGRGPVKAWVGMQFTDPSIADAVRSAREWGADRLVAVAVYPICGPSTTVAALAEVDRAVAAEGWNVEVRGVSGWHRHPAYVRVRADAIRGVLQRDGLSLDDPRTKLVFSAHGTPMKYVQAGSRYVEYVEELCRAVSAELGGVEYVLGYQNHDNRPGVEWTQPDTESVVRSIDADRIVVEPMSFMHEQSETLAELDHAMRAVAEGRGLAFHRVPVPHDAPAFTALLADLVDGAVALRPCRCSPGSWCTNAPAAVA
jgi:ferrochelatase